MLKTTIAKLMSLPLPVHAGLAAAAVAGFQLIKARLDASYAASGYPVDYATGQLAFDHRLLEGYYAVMQQAGTLGIYWRTQFIDFGFLGFVALMRLTLGSLIARAGRTGSLTRRLGVAVVYAAVIGASFDALENLLSFAMLPQAVAIPQWLVLCYSSAAAVKFAALVLAMTVMVLACISAGVGLFRRRLVA